MKKALKIIGVVIIISIALISVAYTGLRIYIVTNSADETLKDDSHLIPEIISVPDEENAWFDLKKAEEVMYYPKEKEELIIQMANGKEWDEEVAKELIDKNQEAYKYIEIASKKRYFANSSLVDLKIEEINANTIIESENFIRHLNRLYLILAKFNLLEDNFKTGFEEILISIDLSNKIKNNETGKTLIEYLIGMAISNTNYSFVENIFSQVSIHRDNSIVLQRKLEKSKENEKGLAESFKFEYVMMKNEADLLNSGGDRRSTLMDYNPYGIEILKENPWFFEYNSGMTISKTSPFYFKINKFKNMIADNYRRDIENSYRSCNSLIPYERTVDLNGSGKLKIIFTENAIGKILADIISVSFDGLQIKRCAEDFRITALQVQLASDAYKSDKGNYPETLDELRNSGYLATEIPDELHGWDLDYDNEMGRIMRPEGINY